MRLSTIATISVCAVAVNAYNYIDEQGELNALFRRDLDYDDWDVEARDAGSAGFEDSLDHLTIVGRGQPVLTMEEWKDRDRRDREAKQRELEAKRAKRAEEKKANEEKIRQEKRQKAQTPDYQAARKKRKELFGENDKKIQDWYAKYQGSQPTEEVMSEIKETLAERKKLILEQIKQVKEALKAKQKPELAAWPAPEEDLFFGLYFRFDSQERAELLLDTNPETQYSNWATPTKPTGSIWFSSDPLKKAAIDKMFPYAKDGPYVSEIFAYKYEDCWNNYVTDGRLRGLYLLD